MARLMMMGVSDDIREVDGIGELLASAVLDCNEGNEKGTTFQPHSQRRCTFSSGLHDNVPCYIPAAAALSECEQTVTDVILNQTGGQNCNLDICFEDGVVWMIRLRFGEPTVLPRDAQTIVFKSEVETLKFLARTNIRSPELFHHCPDESEIGTPYILMEKLSSKPLKWDEAAPQQRTKIMEQLVDVFLELEKYPFSATGSLSEGGLIGPFVQGHMFVSPSESLGPYSTLEESLTSILEHEKGMIMSGELRLPLTTT
jgi:hypothetical protein